MRALLIVITILAILAEPAEARKRRYRKRCRVQPQVVEIDPAAQAVAQSRVDEMCRRGYYWHLPFSHGCIPGRNLWSQTGARFEGCGWGRRGRNPRTLGTCRPRGRRRRKCIADAVANGPRGSFRLRLWR